MKDIASGIQYFFFHAVGLFYLNFRFLPAVVPDEESHSVCSARSRSGCSAMKMHRWTHTLVDNARRKMQAVSITPFIMLLLTGVLSAVVALNLVHEDVA